MNRTTSPISRGTVVTGAVLIALVGLVHFIEAPEYLDEVKYIGVLFILNGIGAVVAAAGILMNRRPAWLLGILLAGGAFVAFILSRTVGLPGFHETEWEGMGIVSLIIEAGFVAVAARALSARAPRPVQAARGRRRTEAWSA